MLLRSIVLMGALSLTACSTGVQVGKNFDLKGVSTQLKRGETDQKQVRQMLGEPSNIGVHVDTGGQQFDEWTYYFASGQLPNLSQPNMKLLQIKFNSQGVVQGYNWSSGRD